MCCCFFAAKHHLRFGITLSSDLQLETLEDLGKVSRRFGGAAEAVCAALGVVDSVIFLRIVPW